ncbi:MAG: hypothetical protein K2U26_07325 [Cyclobacteriaceae bacterium]|nr:hypothetical protein [Cyclobacteriaceae bacterium]
MKTKLTLTVRKSVIMNARRYSKRTGKSISTLFEELFESRAENRIPTEAQKAARRLLENLERTKSVKTVEDRIALIAHVARKFA